MSTASPGSSSGQSAPSQPLAHSQPAAHDNYTFCVDYRGVLAVEVLASTLRTRLYRALQRSALRPGDSAIAPRETLRLGELAGEAAGEVVGEVVVGRLDLHELALLLASTANSEHELWLRYLQTRAPTLLTCLMSTGACSPGYSTGDDDDDNDGGAYAVLPTAEEWLAHLRGFLLLRLRRHVGGAQLLDGVQMRDLLMGPMLGEGAYGSVYLARHRVLPDRWYACSPDPLRHAPLALSAMLP